MVSLSSSESVSCVESAMHENPNSLIFLFASRFSSPQSKLALVHLLGDTTHFILFRVAFPCGSDRGRCEGSHEACETLLFVHLRATSEFPSAYRPKLGTMSSNVPPLETETEIGELLMPEDQVIL